jgi:signal-transduction protein with cAMP-binding, CBS, and nucleotidyltransferase domain
MEDIYLIRHGKINVFDENYNLLLVLKDQDYFGLYQCMFDMTSGNYYRT